MGPSTVVLEGITNAETEVALALACREGLVLASDLLIQNVRLASDSTAVIKNLKGGRTGREAFESV
jgi:ribonuclease HI